MSAEKITNPSADGIALAAKAASNGRKLPPVHLWDPPFCGDLDMRIAKDGTWFYLGSPIGRFELVKLFSSILRRDGDKYYLVTPVEKVGIKVDESPFVAVDFTVNGRGKNQVICFETHVGDYVRASTENAIRVVRNKNTGEPSPYIHIRAGLEALIDRKSFYRLVELGVHQPVNGKQWFGIFSAGNFFPIIPSADLKDEEV